MPAARSTTELHTEQEPRPGFTRILLPMALLAVLAAFLLWQIRELISTAAWVDHTDRVIAQCHIVENDVVFMETGLRGYVITRNPEFLATYDEARPRVPGSLELLAGLVSNNPNQTPHVESIRQNLLPWYDYATRVIALAKAGKDPSPLVKAGLGKKHTDEIHRQIRAILDAEETLRQSRVHDSLLAADTAFGYSLFAFVVLGLLLARALVLARRNESALFRSEQRFRLLVQNAQEYAIFMLDPQGVIQSWNLGAERLKGYKSDEIIGKHFSIFYPPEVARSGHPMRELELAVRNGQYEEEGWRIRKDGSKFWADVVITPIRNGTHIGFAKITRDLTAKKLAEMELAHAKENLEVRVRDRTAELQKAVQTREEVLAVVSHDLKNPLSAIHLNAQLLEKYMAKNAIPPSHVAQVRRIDQAAQRMDQLISDILDVTKIEAGTFAIEKSSERVETLIQETVELHEPLASEKDIGFDVDVAPGCCAVFCDHKRILQVLSNILGNAIKFTPRGGRIRIGAKPIEPDQVELFVSDTGPGIRAEDQPKIFSRYWQVRETAAKGVGLGLAIAKGIVEAHGGTIRVDSAPGKGTTFRFVLPR
jgi:PAS domain S-box-containing protein